MLVFVMFVTAQCEERKIARKKIYAPRVAHKKENHAAVFYSFSSQKKNRARDFAEENKFLHGK